MIQRFLCSSRHCLWLPKAKVIDLGTIISSLHFRYMSSRSRELLQTFQKNEKNYISESDTSFVHPILNRFKQKITSDPSLAFFIGKFKKHETISFEFRHNDREEFDDAFEIEDDNAPEVIISDETDEKIDAAESEGYAIMRFFTIKLSKPNRPLLQFEFAVQEPSNRITILNVRVIRDMHNVYDISSHQLDIKQLQALVDYITERIGGDIGEFVVNYSNMMDNKMHQLYLKDVQEYIQS